MYRLLWFVTAFMLCLSEPIVIQEDVQTETVSVEVIESQKKNTLCSSFLIQINKSLANLVVNFVS